MICENAALVQGSVGQTLGLQLPGEWEGLSVTAVFSAGAVRRDVPVLGGEITIPWELLRDCGAPLTLCFHAAAADGQLVIATANCDPIRILPSAAPSGEEPEAPSPARADQIQALAQQAMAAAQSVCTQAAQGAFDGTDGVSPSLAVSEIEGGHRIVVTDAAGSRSFDVLDGTDGVDGEVTRSALAAALETKADVDGSYDDMSVGSAKQLAATVGVTDKVPYTFRTSGGTADIGDRENDRLVGGTIAWNQRFPKKTLNYSGSNFTVVSSGDGKFTVTVTAALNTESGNATNLGADSFEANHVYVWLARDRSVSMRLKGYSRFSNTVFKPASASYNNVCVVFRNTAPGSYTLYPQLFDLTRMFGSAIADYVYGLETNRAGDGVAWFKKLFPRDYYAYDALSLQSVRASAHRTVGFNAYDHAAGAAKLAGGQPYQITGAYTALSFRGETVTPDEDGYFTPAGSGVLTVTGGSAASTCVHLVWDGERDGEYAPYSEHSYALDAALTLRGLPKLDANDNLYYDGDVYASDGTVTRLFAQRDYESGDEALSDAVTDGVHTVYRLSAPLLESAGSFADPQVVDDFGTEEYTDAAVEAGLRDVAVPVGHTTRYMNNLRAKLEMMPSSPEGDGDYLVRQSGGTNSYVEYLDGGRIDALEQKLPSPPDADGSYRLTLTVSNGVKSYAWTAL